MMTKEEKELLKKVLCEQLPYGVQVEIEGYHSGILKGIDGDTISTDRGINYPLWLVKPYLRPMSSMTEEEKKEFIHYAGYEVEESVNGRHYEYYLIDYVGTPEEPTYNCDSIDWLNKHHFDCRGLIKMGLAKAAVGNDNPYSWRKEA